MGWGSRCPSDGGRSPGGARRRDTAPFAGRCRSHPHNSGLIGGHQGLDRHPWLGHARGETVLRPPQRERAAAEGPPGGLKAPRAEQSLAGARQAEGRQCLGGAGVKDIHHPQGKAWLLLAPRGHGDPLPPAPWWAGVPRHGQCQCPLLTLATIPAPRGGGRLRTVSWWAESGEGLRGQKPGSGKAVKGVKGEPGPGRPLPTSDPILPTPGEHWPPSRPQLLSAGR